MVMAQLIGIALWALIPGFVAKKKGRNFWGYYFLSFLISPLITMIVTFCLSNLNEANLIESTTANVENVESNETDVVRYCRKCGNTLLERAKFCNKCGTEILIEIEEQKITKKCELCYKETDRLSYCEIKDEYGTSYRNICDECVSKYNAKEIK